MPTDFPFRIDTRWRWPLGLLGVTPKRAYVRVDDDRLFIRYGFWKLETPLTNVCHTEQSGSYRWFRIIGPHLSGKDSGVTFGSSTSRGLCICFHEPVPAIEPFGILKHSAVTVTVADVDGLAALLNDKRPDQ